MRHGQLCEFKIMRRKQRQAAVACQHPGGNRVGER